MRKIFIHIGCGKTGSSALQVWLNQNSTQLNESGIYYPVFGSRVEDDQITSGNGTHAVAAIQTGKTKDFFCQLLSECSENILLSSEAFQVLTPSQIDELKCTLADLDLEPVIIAYVRDLVDILNSGYSQLVKRHSFHKKFVDYILTLKDVNHLQQFEVIDIWSDVFPNVTVLHYDSDKKNLDHSFLRALNVNSNKIPEMKKSIVNRSLSPFELELLRYVNELYSSNFSSSNDRFSTKISDALIKLTPNENTAIIYNEEIKSHLESIFGEALNNFNNKYFHGKPTLAIFRQESKNIIENQHEIDYKFKEVLKVLMGMVTPLDVDSLVQKELTDKQPYDVKDSRFVEALHSLALSFESNDIHKALQFLSAAKVLRPNGPIINAKINEYKSKLHHLNLNKISISWDYHSLNYRGEIYTSTFLQPGWREKHIINFGGVINTLILEHKDGKDAVWYFDSNGCFLGDDISKLELTQTECNRLTCLIFQQAIDELSGNSAPQVLVPLLQRKNFFFSQIKKLINATHALNPNDPLTNQQQEVMNQLFVPGRTLQDEYISNKNHNEIIKFKIGNLSYTAQHGLILSDFIIAYPCKNNNGGSLIIFEGGQYNSRFSLIDLANFTLYERPMGGLRSSIKHPLSLLLDHIANHSASIERYLLNPTISKGCILRNEHLGHNLWNDLTGLYRIESQGFLNETNEIILFNGERVEPWINIKKFSPKAIINRSIKTQNDLIEYCYKNHKFPVRISDDFIPDTIPRRIIAYCSERCHDDISRSSEELRVVFGLRLENRTWINQKEIFLELAKYLSDKTRKLTIIVDGHDIIASTNKLHSSHHESSDGRIITLEKEVVEYLISETYNTNIKIIDAVAMSIERSVAWINSADFFVAPWGAGLSKYKWISNLPGVIATSRWNFANKQDLKIYESSKFREGATECVYVEPEYIEDRDCTTNNVIIQGQPEHPSRADFLVDVFGVKLAVEKVLLQLERHL